MKNRKALILILICTLGASALTYVLAQAPTQPFWIIGGAYPVSQYYSIFADGSNHFAKDAWGQVAANFGGTNETDIFQRCINAISVSGNYKHPYDVTGDLPKIQIFSPMTITNLVTINKPMIIDFGWQRITISAGGGFVIPQKTTAVTIENGGFYVGSGVTAFAIDGTQNLIMKNLHFKNSSSAYDSAINMTATDASCNFIRLESIYITGATTGIYIGGNETNGYSTELELDNIQISDTTTCIELDYVQSISLREPTLADSTDGIIIRGSTEVDIYHGDFERNSNSHINFADSNILGVATSLRITLEQCLFGQNTSSAFVAIQYTGPLRNVGNIILDQCSFWVQAQQYFNDTWHFSYVEFRQPFFGNTGLNFPTLSQLSHRYVGRAYQNMGTASKSNDDWQAHSLVGDPTMIQLTVEAIDANYVCQIKTTNSTHFQIYLYDLTAAGVENVDKTINWYAEYQP